MVSFSRSSLLKFLRFEERFRKAMFSWRISVDGRPNCREKAVVSNYSGIVWLEPNFLLILVRFFCVNPGKLFPLDGKEKAPSLITPVLYYHLHVHGLNLSQENYQTNPTPQVLLPIGYCFAVNRVPVRGLVRRLVARLSRSAVLGACITTVASSLEANHRGSLNCSIPLR